jgi:hypothetical protein
MIRFSDSNEDIKNEKEEEGLTAAWARRLCAAPNAKRAINVEHSVCHAKLAHRVFKRIRANWFYLAITGLRHNS